VPGDTAKTPEYKNYYQIIREKIRRLAYSHYKKLEEGEVYLTFLLSSSGELISITINEKNSSPDEYLRSIALKSVQEAIPFPEFPEKLKNHTQLTFHVIISFELK
jgi:TonB family protein